MSKFVIGISGVTCGGKTTLTQLLRRTFPKCRVLHQDKYFYSDDDPRHVRMPEAQNHVNYETLSALDMPRMQEDVSQILKADWTETDTESKLPGHDTSPNFEAQDLVHNAQDLDLGDGFSRHKDVSILLLEGFLLFGSEFIYESCDIRFFLALNEKDCSERRSVRTCYNPPDTPGYFEHGIWKEYTKHFSDVILKKKDGIHILDGKTDINEMRQNAVALILEAMDKKYPLQE